jgi:hypothetical protein
MNEEMKKFLKEELCAKWSAIQAQQSSHVLIEVPYKHLRGGTEGNPENDRDLVVGHRLKPDASQLQVCIITILLTTFICITKKCQMQYLLLCNQQWSEVLLPLTADTKLPFKRTSVCQHSVQLDLYLQCCQALTVVCMRKKCCTCSMTHSTSYALVKRRNYWMQISCIPI